jgi:hypothetical protein
MVGDEGVEIVGTKLGHQEVGSSKMLAAIHQISSHHNAEVL